MLSIICYTDKNAWAGSIKKPGGIILYIAIDEYILNMLYFYI
jgi:hypothetical protein